MQIMGVSQRALSFKLQHWLAINKLKHVFVDI